MRTITGLILFALLTVSSSFAQAARLEFQRPEELLYEAEFSRALLRKLDVADFHFSAARVPANDAKAAADRGKETFSLQLKGEVKSKGFFARLFNLNFLQRITSTVEANSFSVKKTKRFDQQGKRQRESETVYDRVAGKVVWTEHDLRDPSREPRVESSAIDGEVQDVLSAIYFLRTQPLETGKSFQLQVTDSGRVYNVPIRVGERKKFKTVLGKVDTFKLEVELFGAERLIPSEGQFAIWLTADARRVPVKARIKNQYGTFDIKLKKLVNNSELAQSNRFPK
jgi:uncharacterized protein DUF3108